MRKPLTGCFRGAGRGAAACFARSAGIAVLAALVTGLAPLGVQASTLFRSPDDNSAVFRVEPSLQLFSTLCALYAAGYRIAPAGVPVELATLPQRMAVTDGPSVIKLRQFYQEHQLDTPEATLARYVSFAMVVGPPPAFSFVVPQEDVPPDVRALAGFQKVLGDFYNEQHIDRLWADVAPIYAREADRMRGPVSQLVTVASAYVRRMGSFSPGRSFNVFVDPLVGGVSNFRIYSEKYDVVVSQASEDAFGEIRHALLHFLLDPLPFNNLAVVDSKQYLLNFAVRAPRLPAGYKDDFVAFTDECLVRAVELHLRSLTAADRDAVLDQNDRDGFLLVRPLYFGLETYGRSVSTLQQYFPQLVESIDVQSESAREQQVVFAPAAAAPAAAADAEGDQIGRWLDEGGQQIAMRDANGAVVTFQRVLKSDPGNIRALYGLAVASVLTGQGERARQLFGQIVSSPVATSAADPSVLAWSHIYLGRMNDLTGRRMDAVAEYRAALAVAGVPVAAQAAARNGVEKPYDVKGTNPGSTPHP